MPDMQASSFPETRRRFLALCASAGLGNSLFSGALLALSTQADAQQQQQDPGPSAPTPRAAYPKVTDEMLSAAAAIAGLEINETQRKLMLESVTQQRDSLKPIRALKLPNSVPPSFSFDPVPNGFKIDNVRKPIRISAAPDVKALASNENTLAFATVRELAELLKTRKVTSVQLTKMYLERLRRYDPTLHFVITYTEERALKQAEAADKEIAAGKYRGPLHGIPWGGKDLLSVKNYRTTWGAGGMEEQQFDYDATVVQRLDAAGAVLLAKLSMGALASGDLWFGARTRNPWNPKQGSSGSSAGSGSAVAAGCVGFAIGTETQGSISAPSTRNGCSGLRPTFGFVPRTGAMALSWTMDKIGAITRSVEDCAIVIQAIHGPDGQDRTIRDAAFNWDANFDWKKLRIGYFEDDFTLKPPAPPTDADRARGNNFNPQQDYDRRKYDNQFDQAALAAIRKMGVNLISVKVPDLPYRAITPVLQAEAAAAFDYLTVDGRDNLLTAQDRGGWPNQFRTAHLYSAVDYIQAMRARSLVIDAWAKLFETVDVIVCPSSGMQLSATNLSGHPAIIIPNGVRGNDAPVQADNGDGSPRNSGGPNTPVSITFLGQLYSDARLAAFARAYQEATGFHKLHPKLDA